MAGEEGNVQGNQTGDVTGQTQQTQQPAWVAQLPTDLKTNEVFTKYPTIGDLGKSHIDVLGKIKEFEGKVVEFDQYKANSIPKLPENATKEQVDAFYTSLGRPADPKEYEFPKGEGVVHDETMTAWARDVFFKAGLSKSQGAAISQEWDQFVQGLAKAQEEMVQADITARNEAFRKQFATQEEHDATLETVSRVWKRVVQQFSTQEEDFDLGKYMLKEGLGKEPTFLRVLINLAKLTGEDFSLKPVQKRGPVGGGEAGMIYDKTPQHQPK